MSVNPAMYETHTIATDASADDYCDAVRMWGSFNLSIYGSSWAGTIRLQRSMDGGTTWTDVATYTTNTETKINDGSSSGALYRIGQSSGDYGSGSVTMYIQG
jgi:hypothetical protein